MAFGGFNQDGGGDMAEINVIPLVDIMLVLLVIFIITAPVITHSVKVDLARVLTQARAAGVLRIGFITEPEGGAP